ncbi:MAG: hypothetical protein ABI612_04430 [Betaproteobacteria bacterium]
MNLNYRNKSTLALFFVLAMAWFNSAQAQISIVAPEENSSLSKTTVLKGNCTGSKNVVLNGPGIHKNKSISCQKGDKSAHFWAYSFENAYKEMPDGAVLVTAAQGGQLAQRTFVKGSGSGAPTPPAAKCYLNGLNIDSGKGVTAYRARTVSRDQSCISQRRLCNNGSLTGSYAYVACTVAAATTPAPAPASGGQVIPPALRRLRLHQRLCLHPRLRQHRRPVPVVRPRVHPVSIPQKRQAKISSSYFGN